MASVKKKKDLTPEEREALARANQEETQAPDAPATEGGEAAVMAESEETGSEAQTVLTADSASTAPVDGLEVASASTTAFWSSDAPSMAASLFDMSAGSQASSLFDAPAAIAFDSLGSMESPFASASPLADDSGFASAFLASDASSFDGPAFAMSFGDGPSSTAPAVASDYSPGEIAEMRQSLMDRADEFAAMVQEAVAISFPDGPGAIQFDTFG